MTFSLQQALAVLQMNQMELRQWLYDEIEKNPLLELNERKRAASSAPEPTASITLHEHLQAQIREQCLSAEEALEAQAILEQLDERGFLPETQQDTKVLQILQTFDPPGIFARSLQESLILQLRNKRSTLAFRIVQHCFDDLLHERYSAIKRKLQVPAIESAIAELSHLKLRPASVFHQDCAAPIYPDLSICKTETGWTLEVVEDELPQFCIRDDYLALEPEEAETKETLREFKTNARWLQRCLHRRKKLLQEVGKRLLCKQASFLNQQGPLTLLTIKELAETLQIHESTLSRALAGKYASTPRGIIPLRALLSSAPNTVNARELLARLIQQENKQQPLTDDELSQELQKKGASIARRTIAKYRKQLNIGSANQRKNYPSRG